MPLELREGEASGPLVALNHIKVKVRPQSQAVSGQSCTEWVLTFLLGGFLEFCAPGTAWILCKPRTCLLLMGNTELTHAREGTGQTLVLPWHLHRLGVPRLLEAVVPVSSPISSGSCPYIPRDPPWGLLRAPGFGLVSSDLKTEDIL